MKQYLKTLLITIGGLGVLAGIAGAVIGLQRRSNRLKNNVIDDATDSSTSSSAPQQLTPSIQVTGFETDYYADDFPSYTEFQVPVNIITTNLPSIVCDFYVSSSADLASKDTFSMKTKYTYTSTSTGNIAENPDVDKVFKEQNSFPLTIPTDHEYDLYRVEVKCDDTSYDVSSFGEFKIHRITPPAASVNLSLDKIYYTATDTKTSIPVTFTVGTGNVPLGATKKLAYSLASTDGHVIYDSINVKPVGSTGTGVNGKTGSLASEGSYVLSLELLPYDLTFSYSLHVSITVDGVENGSSVGFNAKGSPSPYTDFVDPHTNGLVGYDPASCVFTFTDTKSITTKTYYVSSDFKYATWPLYISWEKQACSQTSAYFSSTDLKIEYGYNLDGILGGFPLNLNFCAPSSEGHVGRCRLVVKNSASNAPITSKFYFQMSGMTTTSPTIKLPSSSSLHASQNGCSTFNFTVTYPYDKPEYSNYFLKVYMDDVLVVPDSDFCGFKVEEFGKEKTTVLTGACVKLVSNGGSLSLPAPTSTLNVHTIKVTIESAETGGSLIAAQITEISLS